MPLLYSATTCWYEDLSLCHGPSIPASGIYRGLTGTIDTIPHGVYAGTVCMYYTVLHVLWVCVYYSIAIDVHTEYSDRCTYDTGMQMSGDCTMCCCPYVYKHCYMYVHVFK